MCSECISGGSSCMQVPSWVQMHTTLLKTRRSGRLPEFISQSQDFPTEKWKSRAYLDPYWAPAGDVRVPIADLIGYVRLQL